MEFQICLSGFRCNLTKYRFEKVRAEIFADKHFLPDTKTRKAIRNPHITAVTAPNKEGKRACDSLAHVSQGRSSSVSCERSRDQNHPSRSRNELVLSERGKTDSCRIGEDRNGEGSPMRRGIIAITRGASAEVFENNVHHVILLLPSGRKLNTVS